MLMKIQVLKLHNNAARYKGSNTGKRARRKNLRHPKKSMKQNKKLTLLYFELCSPTDGGERGSEPIFSGL
jgi:hypothetical protein